MKNTLLIIATTLFVLLFSFSCKYRGPEDLPKLKKRFKNQIESFEKQKNKTNKRVENGVEELSTFEKSLQNAENADKEFKKVYTDWHRVNKNVKNLNKEFQKLKSDASNLFTAMEDQTNSLSDAKTKAELLKALRTTKNDYFKTLNKTDGTIAKLNSLHAEALDVVKALEVAVALGQIADIQSGLKNIETKVSGIMKDLNNTITESKSLYEKRMGGM